MGRKAGLRGKRAGLRTLGPSHTSVRTLGAKFPSTSRGVRSLARGVVGALGGGRCLGKVRPVSARAALEAEAAVRARRGGAVGGVINRSQAEAGRRRSGRSGREAGGWRASP